MATHPVVQRLFDWLVDGSPGARTPMVIIGHMGRELIEAGVPVERMSAFVSTLHPHISARRFTWTPAMKDAEVGELPFAMQVIPEFKVSPVMKVKETGVELRFRLEGTEPLIPDLEGLRKQGFTDYIVLPLNFMGGSIHTITYATRRAGGFTDEHLDVLRHVNRPLSRVAENLALMRTAVNLLNTYVGRSAGERILSGHIQRGDTESIRCVVWFSDLRGFTSMSDDATPTETIAVLNEFFDCQVPHIELNGGQVLKFIGDGMLAIFPIDEKCTVRTAGENAVKASQAAFTALDALNQKRAGKSQPPLRFGVALHLGDVAFGNIGGANRLDFTAIGAAVNVASRIEGLTGKLGKNALLSGELARELSVGTREVGTFELKGVSAPQGVFELS